jgi:putative transcriptional regulator
MKREDFDGIMQGLREARAHARGEDVPGLKVHLPKNLDVAAIRKQTGLSQESFANTIAVPVGTLRNWEQKRRQPEGPARVLLALLDHNPTLVVETLVPKKGVQGGPVVARAGAKRGATRGAHGRRKTRAKA